MATANPDLSGQQENETPVSQPKNVSPLQFFGNTGLARGVTADFRPQVQPVPPEADPVVVVVTDEAGLDPAIPEDPEVEPEDEDAGFAELLAEGIEQETESTVADDSTGSG